MGGWAGRVQGVRRQADAAWASPGTAPPTSPRIEGTTTETHGPQQVPSLSEPTQPDFPQGEADPVSAHGSQHHTPGEERGESICAHTQQNGWEHAEDELPSRRMMTQGREPALGATSPFQSKPGRTQREPSAAVGGKPIRALSAPRDPFQVTTVAKFLRRNNACVSGAL